MVARKVTDDDILAIAADASYQNDDQRAAKLGIHVRTYYSRKASAQVVEQTGKPAAEPLLAPLDGRHIGKVTHQVNAQGEVERQWIREGDDPDRRLEIMQAMIDGFKSELPEYRPVKPPKLTDTKLMSQYTITDYHLGALAWAPESGADWNLQIAEDLIYRWFELAIASSPQSEQAVFAQLGDFKHFDSLSPKTPAHGHILDASARFGEIVEAAGRIARRVIRALLTKHKHVHVIWLEGNHDEASTLVERSWMAAYYENEPRVSVDTTQDIYAAYKWGDVGLFYHHGHKQKPETVDRVFVGKYPEIYGQTKHREGHMGDKHHDKVVETGLMRVNQHRTLEAKDAYSSRAGYLAGRDAKVITYHKEHGRVGELVIKPSMLQGAA